MVLIAIVGEMGCHSDDTLAFTPSGFKKHTDLDIGDEVYGMDKKGNFKRTKILKKFEYDYKGKLLHFFSDNYDFLVTPNHNMLIKLSAKSQWQYIKASELVDSTLKGVIYFSNYFWNICEEKFGSKNITSEKYTGKVWCFETELGNFFTTRNGKVSVSGNSGKTLALTYLAYRKYLKGMTVFSNYHITFPTFENFKAPDVRYVRKMVDVLNMREGFFAGDELWMSCDCLTGDTLISSMEGSEYFANNCDSFLSADFNSCKIIPTENSASAMRSLKTNEKLVKISTRTRDITCSGNHVFFSITRDTNLFNRKQLTEENLYKFIREKKASEIRWGDRVLIASKLPEPKEEKIDMKTSQLLGYIMGDGTIEYPHRWAIHLDDKDLGCLKKYGRIAKSLGFSTSLFRHNHSHAYRLRIFGKKKIQELLAKINDATIDGKFSTYLEDIPKVVSESNNRVVGAFIRGFLDAEGCILKTISPTNHEYIKINFVQKNRLALDKIKHLLLRFGIDSGKVIQRKEKNRFPIFTFDIKDSLSIKIFQKHIGFTHPLKKIKLNHFVCKHNNKNYNRIIFAGGTKRKIIGDLEIGFITKVEEVSLPKDEKLYDVTIPKYENYIANGFIVHNSRMSATKKNKFVTSILGKSRKRNIHIGYTTQNFHQIDKRIRDVTDFIAFPQLNKDESICRLEVMTLPSMTPMQTYKFRTAPLFKFYDTNEEIEAFESEDDEKKKKKETSEEPAIETEDDYKDDALEDGDSDIDV